MLGPSPAVRESTLHLPFSGAGLEGDKRLSSLDLNSSTCRSVCLCVPRHDINHHIVFKLVSSDLVSFPQFECLPTSSELARSARAAFQCYDLMLGPSSLIYYFDLDVF